MISGRTVKLTLLLILLSTLVESGYCNRRKKVSPQKVELHTPYLKPSTQANCTPLRWPTKLLEQYDTVSITFIGDVMQHGKQLKSALIDGKDGYLPESYNYSNTFANIEEQLKEADLAVANMEFPIGVPPYSGYPIFSTPESLLWQAQESGIDLFLLANNHLLDRGKRGISRTLDEYDKAGARYIGAYRDSTEACRLNPALFNIRGVRIAFINFTYGTNGFDVPEPFEIDMMDSTKVKRDIQKGKQMGADIIVALPHWGNEYQLNPSAHQRKWAAMLHREGVDIIIGSHPHVPQTGEITPHSVIFYSLGNYISNQSTPDYTQLELMVTIDIIKNNITREIEFLDTEYEFLWCFKRGEYIDDYTTVPVKELLDKPELVKDRVQYNRMVKTYNSFIEQNLIKNYRYGREKN